MTVENVKAPADAGDSTEDVPAPSVRVILADSQAIYRVGMRKIFALEDDIRWIALDAIDGYETDESVRRLVVKTPTLPV